MAIAMTLKSYLESEGIHYDLIQHSKTATSMQTAENAHISGEKIAKAVILQDEDGYLMAVVPATHKVQLGQLRKRYHRYLSLAREDDLSNIFKDCELGAVPPIGKAYNMSVIFDDRLNECSDIYFEAGNHSDLVHISTSEFRQLMGDVPHGEISRHI